MALLAVLAVAAVVIAWLVLQPILQRRRRSLATASPFPAAWRHILRERVPAYGRLDTPRRERLERRIQALLAEKPFIGCAGMEITDEVRVTIAAQAGLLLLGRPNEHLPALREILVYPAAFIVERVRAEPSGVLQENRQALAGESWSRGQVILSWEDVVAGAADPDDGRNVVIHELAHQLDQQKGFANGAPPMRGGAARQRWSRVLGQEFAMLQHRLAWGEPTLINPYGATDPAEFFAVASEVFFEQPHAMARWHPTLFELFAQYHRLDPREWQPG